MTYARSSSVPLSIVVVDPTGGERLLATLRDLRDARMGLSCDVIGVVGGRDVGLLPVLRQEFPLVALYQAWGDRDVGSLYGVGCRAATGKHLLLLDGTARVRGAAIADMTAFMEQGPWIAMVAPRMLTTDGRELAAGRLFPTVGNTLAELDGRAAADAGTPAPRLQHALDRRVTTPKEVEAVVGGCCLIKRQAFEQVGGFEPGYPRAGVTLDWCRRARQGGWSVFYHPGQTVQLLDDTLDDPRQAGAQLAAACRFIRRHRGLSELLVLELLVGLSIVRGLLVGGAALIPGTHRAGARSTFWRAWYALTALVAPRRAIA